jgi:hypothetical protein
MKAFTFPRAFCVWVLSSMFLIATSKVCRRLIPIGRFGIRKINETQFYQNFGWIGVAGVGAWFGGAAYAWWKCTRFVTHKFYRHVIQQNRNWIHENLEVSRYGNYIYPESVLTSEDDWHESKDKKVMFSALEEEEFPYYGPYTPATPYKKPEAAEE